MCLWFIANHNGHPVRVIHMNTTPHTYSQGLTSAKYATVRSAKGIKIGLQEGTDKVSGAINNTASKLKKTKSTDGNSQSMRAVPVV